MSEFSMVYYNNLLSIGPVIMLMVAFGEIEVTLPPVRSLGAGVSLICFALHANLTLDPNSTREPCDIAH